MAVPCASLATLLVAHHPILDTQPASAADPPPLVVFAEYERRADRTPLPADAAVALEAIRSDPAASGVRIGRSAPGAVTAALDARMLDARQLENGASELSGRLGAGAGKWRLSISADRPIQVMSLLELPSGHLTNLSRGRAGASAGTPPPPSKPDLVVQSPSVSNSSPSAGQSFTLGATVRNQGTARSAATTLRWYRSSDATISTRDTQVGTDAVGALSASGTSCESIGSRAPSSAGTYYYGACVDAVSGESDTRNNCSSGVRVTVPRSGNYVGAIAAGWVGEVCEDGFGWYAALNRSDRSSAISSAESGCRSAGYRGCSWRVWFSRCGALAYGESGSACNLIGGYGGTRSAAERDALSECRADYSNCRIPVGDRSGANASYCNSGAGAAHPPEAQFGSSVTDSRFGVSNPEARPEPKPSRRSDGG